MGLGKAHSGWNQVRRYERDVGSSLIARVVVLLLAINLTIVVAHDTAMAQPNRATEEVDTLGLIIEAEAGWDGFVDRDWPVPVSFLLRNDTNQDIQGTLRLHDSMSGDEVVLGDVIVSPGTTRRFASIQTLQGWFSCSASLTRGQKMIWRRPLSIATGKTFNRGYNYVLSIDQNGRKLSLPDELVNLNLAAVGVAMDDMALPGVKGKPIRSLTAKPWQVPSHPGPLLMVQTIVFYEGATGKDLNPAQWKALTQWVCQGGLLFVENKSKDLIEQLVKLAPLTADVESQSGPFSVRQLGLGTIHGYDRSLLSGSENEKRDSIAYLTAHQGRNAIDSFNDMPDFRGVENREADRYRNLIIALFTIYTLVTGGGALLLFRLNQKQIAIFTVSMVLLTSLIAGTLGGYLRFSKGDLRWMTITQVGVGGLVQVGSIEVQSTGNSSSRVTIKGDNVDEQYIGATREWYYYYNAQQTSYSPFTWQPNQLVNESDVCQIQVPMSPWGRRRCHATAFRAGAAQLDIELKFEPSNPETEVARKESGDVPNGKFSLKLKSRMPFDLTEIFVLIGVTKFAPSTNVAASQQNYRRYWGPHQLNTDPVDGLIDLYQWDPLPVLRAGNEVDAEFGTSFNPPQSQTFAKAAEFWQYRTTFPPRISRVGTTGAWIIGRIGKSPIIEIDESRSDFIAETGTHFFIQEIDPDDLPEALRFTKVPVEPNAKLR